jgi:hypothetical protein
MTKHGQADVTHSSLVGAERWRIEDHNWACGLFSWMVKEHRKTIVMASDGRVPWQIASEMKQTIEEKLEGLEPCNGPH